MKKKKTTYPGLLSEEPLSRKEIEELIKNADPDAAAKYKDEIENDPLRNWQPGSSTPIH